MTAIVVAMTTPSTMIEVGGGRGVERERERQGTEREKGGRGEIERGRERGEEKGGGGGESWHPQEQTSKRNQSLPCLHLTGEF